MNKLSIIFLLTGLMLASCKKYEFTVDNVSDIQIVNTVMNAGPIKAKSYNNNVFWSSIPGINYGAGGFVYSERTTTTTPIIIIRTADTTTNLLNLSYNLPGKLYTLYLSGKFPNLDTMIKEETDFPFISQDRIPPVSDSVINLRFTNLSPNSTSLNIKIQGNSANEAAALGYKSITNFKAYEAKVANSSYKFEIRDASTNNLLLTHTFNITNSNRFKNSALVIRGLKDTTSGPNAFGVSSITY
jgi:hypothetical protein